MAEQNINGFIMESWKSEEPSSAYKCFLDRANRLARKLIQSDLPPEIERSILSGKSGRCRLGNVDIELICKDTSNESRFGMMLIVSGTNGKSSQGT